MKELCPNRKSDLKPFSVSVQECLDSSEDQDVGKAQITDTGKVSFISKGSSLEVVNLQNGQRNASFSFSGVNKKYKVSCFCVYKNKYLVGLSNYNQNQQNGLLCVYDSGVSRVVKAIELPWNPSSICLLKEHGGAGDKHNFIRYHSLFIFVMI